MSLWFLTFVGSVALPIASMALVGSVVAAIPRGTDAVVGPLLALAFTQVAHVPCGVFSWGLCWAMGRKFRLEHRQRIMRAVLDPPGLAHTMDPEVLDAARAADNAWVVNMLEGLNNVGASRLQGAGAIVIVGRAQPVSAAILAVGWIVMGAWRWRKMRESFMVATGQTQALRRSIAMSDLALTPRAAKEVRLYDLGEWIASRFHSEWLTAMNEVWRGRRAATRGAVAIAVLLVGTHVVGLALLAADAAAGRIAIGTLAAALAGVVMARELGEGVMGQWEFDHGLPLVEMVARLESVVAAKADTMPGDQKATAPTRAITVEGVDFHYPGSSRLVLSGLELELPTGTSLAIVGENGAGKTTLVQLLARLRDPTAGRIAVDGTNLGEVDAKSWHDLVAAVSQESLHLPMSVVDNIGAGRTDDRELLRRAASEAGVLALIEALPRGWDTVLSKEFTNGSDLSGGQWQRLALARGLVALATGAEVLILDEPTAHLDVRAEADLYDRFLELTRGHTTVLVSHRFSTVRRADRIVVLEGGRVVESGSHAELMAAGGRYARMFELQAARFTA